MKRGGRESAGVQSDCKIPGPGTTDSKPSEPGGAANPAAHSKRCWCLDADPKGLHERIRALEAGKNVLEKQVLDLTEALAKGIDRVEASAYPIYWKLRAEKAEAEVERLKEELQEHHCINDKGEYV